MPFLAALSKAEAVIKPSQPAFFAVVACDNGMNLRVMTIRFLIIKRRLRTELGRFSRLHKSPFCHNVGPIGLIVAESIARGGFQGAVTNKRCDSNYRAEEINNAD